jgi:hypothetical protein
LYICILTDMYPKYPACYWDEAKISSTNSTAFYRPKTFLG